MREHEVPTHVQAEDKVLLWFTFPQVVAVTAVGALAYGIYHYAPIPSSEVRIGLAVLFALAGLAAIVGRVGGRRLPLVAADLLQYRLGGRCYAGTLVQLVRSEPPAPENDNPGLLQQMTEKARHRLRRLRRKPRGRERRNGRRPLRWLRNRRKPRDRGNGKGGHAAMRRTALLAAARAGLTLTTAGRLRTGHSDPCPGARTPHRGRAHPYPQDEPGPLAERGRLRPARPRPRTAALRRESRRLRGRGHGHPPCRRGDRPQRAGIRRPRWPGAELLGSGKRGGGAVHLLHTAALRRRPVLHLRLGGRVRPGRGRQPEGRTDCRTPCRSWRVSSAMSASLRSTGVRARSPGCCEAGECVHAVEHPFDVVLVNGEEHIAGPMVMRGRVTNVYGSATVSSGDSSTTFYLDPPGSAAFQIPIPTGEGLHELSVEATFEANLRANAPPLVTLTLIPEREEIRLVPVKVWRPGASKVVRETVTVQNKDGTTSSHEISARLTIPSEEIIVVPSVLIKHEEFILGTVNPRGSAYGSKEEILLMALTIGADAPYAPFVPPPVEEEPPPPIQTPLTGDEAEDLFGLFGWEWPW